MTKPVLRWTLLTSVPALMLGMFILRTAAGQEATAVAPQTTLTQPVAPSPSPEQVVSVEQLKLEAFSALKSGNFEQSSALLGKAASLTQDPSIRRMAGWIQQFEVQRQEFASERRKQYEKAVADVKKLIENHKESYALDQAARASLLSDNKEEFRKEPWVDALVKQTIEMAEQFDRDEQWLKAMRLYADLSAIEPAVPEWKEKLKLATRRIRLLALYTPGGIKALQEAETKEREEVDALLNPTTQPTTAKTDDNEQNDAFKIDWRETVEGIEAQMLIDALQQARGHYFKDVENKNLLVGGLKGLRALATTRGLEETFPGLADASQREKFISLLDIRMVEAREAGNEQDAITSMINRISDDVARTVRIDKRVWLSEFADGAFAELDPFSSMIWPSDLEEFNKTTQGEFSGVGIQIQLDEDGSLKVVSPLEDSPAYKAGIKAGDVIAKIDGKNAKGITLNQAVKTITGKSGSIVTLTVRSPDGTVKDFGIKRETIKVASVKGWLHRPGGGWDYFIDPENKIAYLRMTNFTKTTTDELDAAARELRRSGAKGMILDLRYNPGGLLTAAVEVTDKFLGGGTIVSTQAERGTASQPSYTPAHPHADDETDLPLVVLVNQYSASASEIVSGALKDQGRARIVGERTFGKGSVQMLFPLMERSAYLKLTTSHYYLPNGKCIHREENSIEWGVDPDLTIEMTPEQMRAAIDARQELDVLRDAKAPPAEGKLEQLKDESADVKEAVAKASRDPMDSDPQLSAALLLLRMQLAGAQL